MATILTDLKIPAYALAMLKEHEVRGPVPNFTAPDYDMRGVDALIVSVLSPVTAAVIARAPDLRVVGRPGIGVDNVNLADCTAYGVLVVNTPDGPTESTAEHAVGLILAVARRFKQADLGLRTQGWDTPRAPLLGMELQGKTLGLIGLGRIGGRVAHIMGQGMGMRVVAFDPYTTRERAEALGVTLVGSLTDVFRQADVISLHCPALPETRRLVNADTLAQMKPGVLLVNCARGPIVDEAALLAAVRSGHVAGAGLDVFDQEPTPSDNPLLAEPNILVTPHIASYTEDGVRKMYVGVAEEVLTVLRGERPRWLVNPEVLEVAGCRL